MFNQQAISEALVFELIAVSQDIAHFKDAKTKQYIGCNAATLKSFGLHEMRQVIGHTVKEINDVMLPYWGADYADMVDNFDKTVIYTQETIHHNEVTVLGDGRIKLQNLIKIPVLGVKPNAVLGIFTFTQDLTHTLTLEVLYESYCARYSKIEAIKHFLEHVGVLRYFVNLPTEAETRVLIARISKDNCKSIANTFNCSPKTIEMHLHNLRDKIINSDFSLVITAMR